MKTSRFAGTVRLICALALLAFAILVLSNPLCLHAEGEKHFDTPEEAVAALKTAVADRDTNALHSIFGASAHSLVSVDVIEAAAERELFMSRVAAKILLKPASDSKVILQIGSDGWPFPIPLQKSDGHWFFDTKAGAEEILNRRIGANELGTIQVCRTYAQAQQEYASVDRNSDEVLAFAQRLRSTAGSHDGLYWSSKPDEEQSPLGPLIAQARMEGYRQKSKILNDEKSPYHGYYFKILTKQGRHAPGGKYNYIINGHMIGGFALVAWPAHWGNSGVMTFMINQQGKVYEKNLGANTTCKAEAMSSYDPDASWTVVTETEF